MPNLNSMSLLELKELAKENNIKNISKLKKDELITILSQLLKNEINITENDENEYFVSDEKKSEKQYDENGNPIVDYKLTNEGDEIVEGILDILPDGYGFLRGENYL